MREAMKVRTRLLRAAARRLEVNGEVSLSLVLWLVDRLRGERGAPASIPTVERWLRPNLRQLQREATEDGRSLDGVDITTLALARIREVGGLETLDYASALMREPDQVEGLEPRQLAWLETLNDAERVALALATVGGLLGFED